MMLMLRIAVSALLLAALLYVTDTAELKATLLTLDPIYLALACSVIVLTIPAFAWRWSRLSNALDISLPFGRAIQATAHAYFFNQVLISTVGGDAYRILHLRRRQIQLPDALASVLTDRLVGLAGLMALVVIGQPVLFLYIENVQLRWLAVVLCCGALVGFVVLSYGHILFARLADRAWFRPIFRSLNILQETEHRSAVAEGFIMAMLGQLILCCSVWIIARGLALDLTLWHVLFLFTPAYVISLIPVTVGGWGTREGAMVTSLSLMGIPASSALALSVLFGLCMLAVGLLGGLSFLFSTRASHATDGT